MTWNCDTKADMGREPLRGHAPCTTCEPCCVSHWYSDVLRPSCGCDESVARMCNLDRASHVSVMPQVERALCPALELDTATQE